MQAALRPWATAGLALVGAGVIAVTPVAASMHDVQAPTVELTAGFDAWTDLLENTQTNLTDLSEQLPGLLSDGAPAGAPGTDVLLSHGFLYPIDNLGNVLQDQFELLQTDLTGGDFPGFFIDLVNSPAVELDAVLNGIAGPEGLRGLLNPIDIPDVGEDASDSQLGTIANLAAVFGDQLGGFDLGI